jgi:hypothetical protein
VTSTQPYRGRHSSQEPEPVEPSAFMAPPAPEQAPVAPAAEPEPEWVPYWATSPAPAPVAEPQQEYVAYSPPPAMTPMTAPQQLPFPPPPAYNPQATGQFVPLVRPRRRVPGLRLVATVAVVAVLAGLGWFGYRLVDHHDSDSAASSTGLAAPTSGGIRYTSASGHFRVTLSSTPSITTQTTQHDGVTFKTVVAADAEEEGAGEMEISRDIPSAEVPTMLRGFIDGMSRAGTVSDVVSGTYRGVPSITASVVTTDGTHETIAYAYSPRRFYFLLASSKDALTALESTFTPVG